MTIVDLIKDLIDTSKERLKTPISGAFIWSFLIYNWRPITVLLFSKISIEDRICIIDQKYCNVWVIVVPIFIALIYTIGVPMLMVQIDKVLSKTKKARITKIYDDKVDDMDGKIRAAKKEFILKNVESGNREVEELTKQIEALKESNSQMAIAHNNTINQLNSQLNEANKLNQFIKDLAPETVKHLEKSPRYNDKYYAEINSLANGILTSSETKQITSIEIDIDGYLVLKRSNVTQSLINKLIDIKVLVNENERYKITNHGKTYIDSIKKKNIK